ncbi:amino acid/amide ABC transporter membrane protein 1, HAAT family [Tistlia consotensis]|uniref:Amino acid/amide ABC transporter membrane protein 1, HAAT family n=1 Tax=Tistlia consotensis USBA 355 TaxID=560819 RepID=A0A1Y6B8J9_9PROT|nr:branched-chain amino acid ABC transporter permease [Tistlia consotensis]SME91123.1 amino acid/amide ABC transporter membrane protein 1, HAAT family [Tistlia consotensis USBA 355]SNR27135.1 amino acid/amide ABC transporter membrane protein 1, HAAT family [Tistlia consotensis]
MTSILQALFDGLASGAIYGIIALGLSLQFGVMKIINFAHGSFLMVAMYLTFWATSLLGLHLLAAIPLVVAVLYLVGWGTQRWLIEPVYRKEATREPISVLIFTTGLWIFLDNLFLVLAGPDYRTPAGDWANGVFVLGDLIFTYPQVAGLVVSVLVTLLLVLFMRYTRLGRAIRATGQDREAASVLGIDSAAVYRTSFAIGLAILGVAGALLLAIFPVDPFIGDLFGVRAFIIVVLGGIGSIGGALAGGLMVGLIESLGAQFLPITYSEALIFAIFLAVLYFRPQGLFGVERA